MPRTLSQRTIAKAVQSLREYQNEQVRTLSRVPEFGIMLYERDFPDWLVTHAESEYGWEWLKIFMDLRNGRFLFPSGSYFNDDSITGKFLTEGEALILGRAYAGRLVAFASLLAPEGESVTRSLELDGYSVNKNTLALIHFEGPVSAQEEEDRLSTLVKGTGLPNHEVILKHMTDANSLYTEGKHHASLNESRNMIQALIDGVSVETKKHGNHSGGLASGTANRMGYLRDVDFLTPDERAALGSAWGSLSAGSHPGVPERDQARIGLVLALEFGQLLMLKYMNWKSKAYRAFC